MQLNTPSNKHKLNLTTIWIENADTQLAYITFVNSQEEQCKLDPKPQKLEYKKVAKPSFQRERNWVNISTVSLKKLATLSVFKNHLKRLAKKSKTAGPVVAYATVATTIECAWKRLTT